MENIPEIKEHRRRVGRVHIRSQQRRKDKSITLVEGLSSDLNLEKILKCMKKNFQVGGTIIKEDGEVIMQLAGDLREQVADFLLTHNICERDELLIHGY